MLVKASVPDRAELRTREPARLGRPLRVLHIGNVANNAYKNVKLLNEAGFDCDVLCYDYYHIMGTPEWEDADFDGSAADQFRPDWSKVELHGFVRPRWFVQGPGLFCVYYLLARRRGHRLRAAWWWQMLTWSRSLLCGKHEWVVQNGLEAIFRLKGLLFLLGRIARKLGVPIPSDLPAREHVVREFHRLFPDRPDPLTLEDLDMFRSLLPLWKRLFAEYDLVQAYATDPILPLLAGKRPYIAFEHGTLRELPFVPTQVGRTTAIGYALADGVFITNGDCLKSVAPLKITRYAPMVHPLDERDYARIEGLGRRLHEELGATHLFLCTLRHDWAVKGTDVYLRALPLLREALGPTFKLVLARWGGQVRESEELLRSLGVESLVHWMAPLPRPALIRFQKSVDVQFDQVALPHFGATAPEAMAAGVPVLMSYDPASTSWIVPEPAPILTVWTPADVVVQTLVALDPAWRLAYRRRAEGWIREYHSSKRVVEGHVAMYRTVLEPRPDAEEAR